MKKKDRKVPEIPKQLHCEAIRTILTLIGEDPDREGLLETPDRVYRSYGELYAGYAQDPAKVFKTFKDGSCDEMVILKGVPFFSQCEHHILPFFGTASIAYIPDGKIIGLSKMARLLDIYAHRLQVQERLTTQITIALDKYLKPKGSACVLKATHLCMLMRGVRKHNSTMITSSLTGVFKTDQKSRTEFMGLIKD